MSLVADRCSAERAHLDLATVQADPTTRVFELAGDRVLVEETPDGPRLVLKSVGPDDAVGDRVVFLGRDAEGHALLAVLTPRREGEDPAWATLREVGPWLPDDEVDAVMTAQGLAMWHRTHGFCPRCGTPTEVAALGWVRRCPGEGRELYPRTDPAVIMAVVDDADRILLGRSPAWPETRRSVLAGFVEPGESLEDAVRREVAEEVGITVGDVTYAGSQPWPFPASLMVGFLARAKDTEVCCDPIEMAQAEWYTRAEIRAAVARSEVVLPGRLSISRRLIEVWLGASIHVPGVDDRGGETWHRPS